MKLLKYVFVSVASLSLFACGGGGGGGGFTPSPGTTCSSGSYNWQSIGNVVGTAKINYFTNSLYAVSGNNICTLSTTQESANWNCSITYQPPYGSALSSATGAVVDSSGNIYALRICNVSVGCTSKMMKYSPSSSSWSEYSATLPNDLSMTANLVIANNIIYIRGVKYNASLQASSPSLCSFNTASPSNGWSCVADEALDQTNTNFLSGDYMRIALDNNNNILFNRITYSQSIGDPGTYKNPINTSSRQQIGASVALTGQIAVDTSLVYVASGCEQGGSYAGPSIAVSNTSAAPGSSSWAQFKIGSNSTIGVQDVVSDITAGDGQAFYLSKTNQVYKLNISN